MCVCVFLGRQVKSGRLRVGIRFRFRLGQVGTVQGRSWHVWWNGEGMEASPLSPTWQQTDGRVPRPTAAGGCPREGKRVARWPPGYLGKYLDT